MKRIYKTNKNRYANNKQLLLGLFFLFIGFNSLMASGLEQTNYYTDASLKDVKVLEKSIEEEPIKAVYHLFSHGRSGELYLDGKWLNALEIASFIKKQELSTTITSLNIYGCEFAKGEKGKRAVRYLENELGIQVNASTNITGKDGDWLLEVGNIHINNFTNYSHSLQTGPDDDFDGDGALNKNDLDDDNDGILDTEEFRCGGISASETSYTSTANAQQIQASMTRGAAQGDVEINFTDVNGAGAPSYVQYTNGIQYLLNDNDTDGFFQEDIIFTAAAGAVFNKVTYGVNVAVNSVNDAAKDTDRQDITFTWNSGGRAKVNDPDNQLDVSDGSYITSGTTISQLTSQFNGSATWSIEFDAVFSSMFTMTIAHQAVVSGGATPFFGFESFGFVPEMCLDADDDQDGTLNLFDLDSDGDGCSDASESGVSGVLNNSGVLSSAIAQAPYGANGLADNVETTAESGAVNYSSTYHFARSSNYSPCIDSDSDGIVDIEDLDDDNDGILDTLECTSGRTFVSFTGSDFANGLGLNANGSVSGTDQNGNTVTLNFTNLGGASATTLGLQLANNSRNISGVKMNSNIPIYSVGFSDFFDVDNDVDVVLRCPSSPVRNEREVWGFNRDGVYVFTQGHVSKPVSYVGIPNLEELYNNANVNQLIVGDTATLICGGNQENEPNILENTRIDFIEATTEFSMFGSNSAPDFLNNSTQINPAGIYTFYTSPVSNCDDFDKDGISNDLDLDSDGDGCPDAIEGGDSLTIADLVSSSMLGGNSDSAGFIGFAGPVSDNLGTMVDTSSTSVAYGVPVIVGTGQSLGISQTMSAEIIIVDTLQNIALCDNNIPDTVQLSATVKSNPDSAAIYYQWQESTDGGVTYTNLTSDTGTLIIDSIVSLQLTGVDISYDENIYKLILTADGSTCPVELESMISINFSPSVSIDALDTVCQNADTIQLSGTPATGGVFSGVGVDSTTGKFHPATADTGTHQLYHTYVDTNGCSSVDTTEVVVIPSQPITLSIDTVSSIVCGEGTFTADFAMTTPSGTAINWTSSEMSAGTGNISEVLTNNTATPKTVSYYIQAESPNGCSEILDTISITVNPKPTVAPSVCEITICSRDTAIIDFSSTVSNTTISWIGDNETSGTGDIREVLVNVGTSNDTVTYSIIGTSSDGCNSDTVKCRVIVMSKFIINISDRSFCFNDNPQVIAASPIGGIYSGGMYIGDTSGVFDPSIAGLGVHPVIYQYLNPNGCATEPDTAMITVSENPSVNLPTNPICINAAPELLTVSPSGGTFSGVGVDSTGLFNPMIAGVGGHKISYVVVDNTTGCSGGSSVDVLVKSKPVIKISKAGPYCPNDEDAQLVASPFGGTYSGTGVSSTGLFSPSTAGVGLHTISYKVTQNGCTDSTDIEIEVLDGSNLMVSPMGDTICSGDTSLFVVTGNNGHTVNWSTDVFGKSGTGTSIEESFVNNGNTPYTVNFSIESTTGNCVNKIESNLLVNPNPTVHSIPQSAVICDYEDLSVKLNATRPGTTITWELKDNMGIVLDNGTGIDNVNITNSSLSSGTYTLEYTGTLNGCTSEQYQLPITIN